MRAILTTLAALLGAAFAPAQSREALDADARAYLALAARSTPAAQSAPDMTHAVGYHDAVAWTHLTHRPVMVSVRMDCSALCSTLRPEIPATHVADLAGDGAPHLRLIVADAGGQLWRSGERWTTLPTEAAVKAAAANLARHVGPATAWEWKADDYGGATLYRDGVTAGVWAAGRFFVLSSGEWVEAALPQGAPKPPKPARHVAPEAGAHTPTAPAVDAACPGGHCSTGGGLFPLFRR